MKIRNRILDLKKRGLSDNTIMKLTEQDINTLYDTLIFEQVTEIPAKKTFKVGPKGGKVGDIMISQDPATKEVMVTTERNEIEEDMEDSMNFEKGQRTQSPKQVGPSTDDGFGNYDDGTGEFNEAKKKNPWAICTSQLGKEFGTTERSEWTKSQLNKYERCIKDVKKPLKEQKENVSLFLEEQIEKIVLRNLYPKMTKKDFMKYLSEAPTTAPAKPTTKPTTKPGTKPSSPGKNPFPGENPSPKAKLPSPEEAKKIVINTMMDLIYKN
jgi:hypothetical protein